VVIKIILCAVVGYLLGSISVAVLLCRALKHEDVRTQGSCNAGSTNVARVYGMKMGLLTFAGDFLKMAASFGFGYLLLGEDGGAIACMGCLIGHCWPVFFNFKGGKGVAVSAAIALFIDWRLLLILLAVFAVCVLATKRVSVGSLAASLVFTPAMLLLGERRPLNIALGLLVFVIVWLLHIPNIKRLLNHTEGAFRPGSKK